MNELSTVMDEKFKFPAQDRLVIWHIIWSRIETNKDSIQVNPTIIDVPIRNISEKEKGMSLKNIYNYTFQSNPKYIYYANGSN